jgi:hypothetical protein
MTYQSQLVWFNSFLLLIGTSCIKISILLFYRRLVKGLSNPLIKYTIWSSIAFIVLFTIAFLIILLVQCSPISAVWQSINPLYSEPHRCMSQHAVLITTFFSNSIYVFADLLCVTLPAIVVMRLRLDFRSRVALLFVFCVGYL